MNLLLDETHDPATRSWVESANDPDGDFPLQNLPLGVFRPKGTDGRRIGIAIGGMMLDLGAASESGLLDALDPALLAALSAPSLNALMALGRRASQELRFAAHGLLRAGSRRAKEAERCLVDQTGADLLLPAEVGDYADFYASVHHATNVGSMFRPDQPLMPNYKWVPIGYHGRASSLVPGGTPIRRPAGQTREDAAQAPVLGPTRALDYECELAGWIGTGNRLGEPVPIGAAEQQLFGLGLLNDWSARDVQRWEYQPLGPFLAKSFATTVSPWVVTLEALEPFRIPVLPRPAGDPEPLPYLDSEENRIRGGFELELSVYLASARMRQERLAPMRLSRCAASTLYWTMAQLLTHLASNGANLRPGDLLASGTVSGAAKDSLGCLLELTWRGRDPIALPSGETRRFLEDGDEVTIRGRCSREGFAGIGFGACAGTIVAT
ncbi:MAG TPA: fumarylacetoacetase [Gemmatimonadales bacterium]